MFKLAQVRKEYDEAAALCSQINLFGFVDEEMFLTEAWRVVQLGNDKLAEEKFLAASKANPAGIRANFVLGVYYALKVRKASTAEQHFLECTKRRLPTAFSLC